MSYKNAHDLKKQCGVVHRAVVHIVEQVNSGPQLVTATKELTTGIDQMKLMARHISEECLGVQGKILPFALILIKARRELIKNRAAPDTADRVDKAQAGIEFALDKLREFADQALAETKTETLTGHQATDHHADSSSQEVSSLTGASDNVTTTLSFSSPVKTPSSTVTPSPASPKPVEVEKPPSPKPAVKEEPKKVEPVKSVTPPAVKEEPKPKVTEETLSLDLPSPKKVEPKKEEPVKVEAKKEEPPKAEPKKVEPKQEEPKKEESKKEVPKKVEPKVDTKPAEPKPTTPVVKKTSPKASPVITKKADTGSNPKSTTSSTKKSVNSLGSALNQANVGGSVKGRRTSGVKTLSVTLEATEDAVEKCNAARDATSLRAVLLRVEKEKLHLISTLEKQGTPQADFEAVKKALPPKSPAYVFFRLKDSVSEGEWDFVFITWLPEGSPVRDRMIYSSGVGSTAVMLGESRFGKYKTYNALDQVLFSDIETSTTAIKNKTDFLAEENDAALPFSDRELAQRQVEREERQARKELSGKAVKASGFHSDSEAEEALKELLAGSVSWVQLSLDDKYQTIIFKKKENPSGVSELGPLLSTSEPQFYVYTYRDHTPCIIYFCPEKGTTIKNKMVYSTCKAPLSENLMALGFEEVKKLDIRSVDELTVEELDDAYKAKTAFKPANAAASAGPKFDSRGRPVGGKSYGAPMGGLGGLGALVAAGAQKKTPFRPPPGAY